MIALAYLAAAGMEILTKRPWVDEAWFTGPGLDLATRGSFGTLLLDPNGSHLRLYNPSAVLYGIDRYTYWVMPLHLTQLAAWGRLFGFSIFAMRLPSLLWGAIAICSAGAIVRRLFGAGIAPFVAMLVLAVDFGFVSSAADVRMDMTCAALGAAAIAVYLTLRENDLARALLFAHTLAACSIFTHPNGLFSFLALMLITYVLDRSRVTLRPLLVAAIPYLILGGGWAYFCLKHPSAWQAQLAANASDRSSGIRAPWLGIWREINGRFRTHFWPAGAAGKLKVTGLLIYLASLALLAGSRDLRKQTGPRLVAYLAVFQFLFLAIFASLKTEYYIVHIVIYFACAAGIAFAYLWSRGPAWRLISAAALVSYFVVQMATPYHLAFVVRGYQSEFSPLIAYLKSSLRPGDLVCGSSELGFGLGFYNPQVIDDVWLGRWSGKRPTVVVVDRWYYEEVMKVAEQKGIPYKGYFADTLADFRLVHTIPGYRIYRRLNPD